MHPVHVPGERSRYSGDCSAHSEPISEFYYIWLRILPIRQIDNTFIPLFFHWSGPLKSPNNVKKSLQQLLYQLILPGSCMLGRTGNCGISHPWKKILLPSRSVPDKQFAENIIEFPVEKKAIPDLSDDSGFDSECIAKERNGRNFPRIRVREQGYRPEPRAGRITILKKGNGRCHPEVYSGEVTGFCSTG